LKRTALALASAAVLLTGCGGGDENQAQPSSAATNSSATAKTSSEATASPADAAAVLEQLTAAGLLITGSLVITETNDPNNLIGRPGQYTSKVVFADERTGVALDETAPSNDAGGSIEVFIDAATAQARSDYIQQTLTSLGPAAGTEYHYLAGTALVRVTGALVPSVAAEYEAAAAQLG
jgi:hypothetical protein